MNSGSGKTGTKPVHKHSSEREKQVIGKKRMYWVNKLSVYLQQIPMTPTTGACGMCVMPMVFCLGLAGPTNEAIKIKYKVAQVLNNNLKLELNAMHRSLEKV